MLAAGSVLRTSSWKAVSPAPESETTDSESEAGDVEDQRQEFLEPCVKYYMNEKSLAIHSERTEGVLKCGRRVSPHFVVLYELHGIRCSRCFVSDFRLE